MILQDVKLSSVTINYLLQWEYHHFYERLTWCLTTLPWPSQKPESQQWVLDTGQCYPSIDSIMSTGVSVTWKNFDSWGSSCPGQKRAGPSGSSFSRWRRQKQTLLPPYTHTLHAFFYSHLSSHLPSLAQQDGGSARGPFFGWAQRKGNGSMGALGSRASSASPYSWPGFPTCVSFHLLPIWQMEE